MLYKRGKIWYCRIQYAGKVYRKTTGQTDRAAAEKFEEDFRKKIKGVSMYALADERDSTYRSGGAAAVISREWRAECNRAIEDPE